MGAYKQETLVRDDYRGEARTIAMLALEPFHNRLTQLTTALVGQEAAPLDKTLQQIIKTLRESVYPRLIEDIQAYAAQAQREPCEPAVIAPAEASPAYRWEPVFPPSPHPDLLPARRPPQVVVEHSVSSPRTETGSIYR